MFNKRFKDNSKYSSLEKKKEKVITRIAFYNRLLLLLQQPSSSVTYKHLHVTSASYRWHNYK